MHPTHPVCVALALAITVSAQTPQAPTNTKRVEVTDLLERFSLDADGAEFVSRLSERRGLRSGDFSENPGHRTVPFARQLLSIPEEGEFAFGEEEPASIFTEESLVEILLARLGVDDDALEVVKESDRIFLESAFPERLEVVVDEVRAALPPAIRLQARLTRTAGQSTKTLLDETAFLRDGVPDILGEIRKRRAIVDFQVEIAQASASANPTSIEVQSGTTLGLRPRLLPLSEEILIEAFLRRATPIQPENLNFQRDIGPIERVGAHFQEAGALLRIARGDQHVQEWTDLDGATLRLELSADWPERMVPNPNGPTLIASHLLGTKIYGFEWPKLNWEKRGFSIEQIFNRRASVTDPDSTFFDVPGTGSDQVRLLQSRGRLDARIERELRSRVDEALTPVTITAEFFDSPATAEIPKSGAVPNEVRLLGRFQGASLLGVPCSVASGREQSYLKDFEVEVAQAARIPDPRVAVIEDGWFASTTVKRAIGRRPRSVELRLDFTKLHEMRQIQTRLNQQSTAATESQEVVLPVDEVTLEMPDLSSVRFDQTLPLDENGVIVLRRAAPDLLGEGRTFVIRLTVK